MTISPVDETFLGSSRISASNYLHYYYFFTQFINCLVCKCASNSKIFNVKWFKTVNTSFKSSNYRSYRTNIGALLAETIFQIRTSESVSCLWLPAAHLLTAPAGRSHPDFLIILFIFPHSQEVNSLMTVMWIHIPTPALWFLPVSVSVPAHICNTRN